MSAGPHVANCHLCGLSKRVSSDMCQGNPPSDCDHYYCKKCIKSLGLDFSEILWRHIVWPCPGCVEEKRKSAAGQPTGTGRPRGRPPKAAAASAATDDGAMEVEPAPTRKQPHYSHYQVERVLDYKIVKGARLFLIKWEGFPSSQNTWEPYVLLFPYPCWRV